MGAKPCGSAFSAQGDSERVKGVCVVIPVLDEEESIAAVISTKAAKRSMH
jgi:hypothetical protein